MNSFQLNFSSTLQASRQESRRELKQVYTQVRSLDNECLKLKRENSSLKDALVKTEQLLEEGRMDMVSTKSKLNESETERDSLKREVSGGFHYYE